MNFDQSNLIVTLLLVILGVSVLVAVTIIAKTFANEAKEEKAKAARHAAEEQKLKNEKKVRIQPKPKAKPAPRAQKQKDDVSEDDDLVAAAEVYLTYELKEQAITSLEKHLLTNPTDKRALAMLKKAEASG